MLSIQLKIPINFPVSSCFTFTIRNHILQFKSMESMIIILIQNPYSISSSWSNLQGSLLICTILFSYRINCSTWCTKWITRHLISFVALNQMKVNLQGCMRTNLYCGNLDIMVFWRLLGRQDMDTLLKWHINIFQEGRWF